MTLVEVYGMTTSQTSWSVFASCSWALLRSRHFFFEEKSVLSTLEVEVHVSHNKSLSKAHEGKIDPLNLIERMLQSTTLSAGPPGPPTTILRMRA